MHKLFINGENVDSLSGASYQIKNPATSEIVDAVSKGNANDAKSAIDAAEDALEKWSEVAAVQAPTILNRAAQLIRTNEQELATLLTKEQGKTLPESLGEIRFFAKTLDYYSGAKITGSFFALTDRVSAEVVKEPVGVVGGIVPWNNPVMLMGAKVVSSIRSGDSIVVKPASSTPLSTVRCAQLLSEAGLPKGVFNVVPGPGGVVGEELLRNPKVRKISFTGESETGKHIMEVAARDLKRVTLELGGSNPVIVTDDADLDAAVDNTLFGRFRNCGQGCMCIKRAYVFERVADQFIKRLTEKVKSIRVGNGLVQGVTMGPIHSSSQREGFEEQVRDGISKGAEVLTGGKRPAGKEYDNGFFYEPTLLANPDPNSKVVREEVFGPALPIFRVKDMDEAIVKGNDSIFGLGAHLWTRDIQKAMRAARKLKAGTILVNTPYGAGGWEIEVPMGGFKQSGVGREYGIEGMGQYQETKTIVYGT
ncbi:MAG TPA: aldehyde dehydrogenase family protein [Terriglobales bacterium]|nr:aldehyde dehydrogenase family protein [Terriglobales bacterium]